MATKKKVAKRKQKEVFAVSKSVVTLVRRVERVILREPRKFDMDFLLMKYNSKEAAKRRLGRSAPPCNTVGCIAGWAVLLSDRKNIEWGRFDSDTKEPYMDVWQRGAELLGLERGEAGKLFNASQWPGEFYKRYENARGKLGRAKVTVERLEHYIHTGG